MFTISHDLDLVDIASKMRATPSAMKEDHERLVYALVREAYDRVNQKLAMQGSCQPDPLCPLM